MAPGGIENNQARIPNSMTMTRPTIPIPSSRMTRSSPGANHNVSVATTASNFVPALTGSTRSMVSILASFHTREQTNSIVRVFRVWEKRHSKLIRRNIWHRIGQKNIHPVKQPKVLFKTPFSERMLVTNESDRVSESQYWVAKRSAPRFKISDEHLPNIYVTPDLIVSQMY